MRDAYEQAALEYCASRGIPLSEFLHVWCDGDRWAALEWQADQACRCRECGNDTRQTVGPEHVDRWNAELSGHCDTCRAAERLRCDLDGNDHPNQNAGAKLRFWRDKENGDGRVDEPGAAVSEARSVG